MKGKLIVIEGIDSSGKATQVDLLVKKLKKAKKKVATIDFPQYYTSFFGEMIGRCLRGEFGPIEKVNPYLASLPYALDRFLAKNKILRWLREGRIIVANRYSSANQIHQGGKLKDKKARNKFFQWLDQLEFQVLKIPRPDLVVFLKVPVEISQKLLLKRKKRDYLKKIKQDRHEKSRDHLISAYRTANTLASKSKNWATINCLFNKKILAKEVIAKRVWEVVEKFLCT